MAVTDASSQPSVISCDISAKNPAQLQSQSVRIAGSFLRAQLREMVIWRKASARGGGVRWNEGFYAPLPSLVLRLTLAYTLSRDFFPIHLLLYLVFFWFLLRKYPLYFSLIVFIFIFFLISRILHELLTTAMAGYWITP
jgi:hypothetical protein